MKTERYSPIAPSFNAFSLGKARFTFLTDSMVRMEWAEDGVFEDRASFQVVNRAMPKVSYTKNVSGRNVRLQTKNLTVDWMQDDKPFSPSNLKIEFRQESKSGVWKFGLKDKKNLKGSYRTLDGVSGDCYLSSSWDQVTNETKKMRKKIQLTDGILSRSGWAVVDDSGSIVLEPGAGIDGRPWVTTRPKGKRQDLYFLGYGLDYKRALAEAQLVFGRQPLPPRYALGYWYSRYWAYTDKEIEELIGQFDAMGVPIDVMVIDMDWHKMGWTGYTWDTDYFPDPKDLLQWLRARDLKITLNLHPADGVGKHEEAFVAMCQAMKLDPKKTERVPMDITDPQYMDAYFKILHNPMERDGVDFWWMDWQQGKTSRLEGLDPLPWINQLHWEDQESNNNSRRPINFSRFAGLGSGRYPVGFSGDTYTEWESLAFQPWFTSTASNVLYGYWSHDIGGHMPGPISPELYLRWVQFGCYSPVLRTHTTKNAESERRFFAYPDPYSFLMIKAVKKRYELVPYIYSENYKAYESGVSLMRPMYYDFPDKEDAYQAKDQYMFGESLLVAPVISPVNEKTEMAKVKVWLPDGQWFDLATGQTLKEGWHERYYTLEEVPVFARLGAVIPGQISPNRLREGGYENLLITVVPGAAGSYELYEDDGVSNEYKHGSFARIPISQKTIKGKTVLKIGSVAGSYRGFRKNRSVELQLVGCVPPRSVKAAGKTLAWSRRLGVEGWSYDGDTATIHARLKSFDVTKGVTIEIQNGTAPATSMDGWKGLMTRLDKVCRYNNLVSPCHPLHPQERLAVHVAQAGNRIGKNPESFSAELTDFRKTLKQLPSALAVFQAAYVKKKDAKKAAILQKARNILAATLK